MQVRLETEEESEADESEDLISFVEVAIRWKRQFSEAIKHEEAVNPQNLTILLLILYLFFVDLTDGFHVELEAVLEFA